MDRSKSAPQAVPNLWHISALAWAVSHLFFSMVAWPVCINQTGIRLQICLLVAHVAGVACLWRLGSSRCYPERLRHMAILTLVFIYLVPLCMLVTPVMVLAIYAMPGPTWKTVATIFACTAVPLAALRIHSTARNADTGRRLEPCLIKALQGSVIDTKSYSVLFTQVGKHPVGPTRIDGWSMCAAVVTAGPILLAPINFNVTSTILGICALLATPVAMHAVSRMAVHCYLWIYRLARFERNAGISIVVSIRARG